MESKGKVLIIDDNPKNVQVVASILNQNSYDSEFALNGASGLSWLETESFDLVLLDVMMPDEDGFEVCRLIRSNKQLAEIPVIFITAKADRESLVTGFEVGGDDYIIKPFDSRELIARVDNQIELTRSRKLLVELNNNLTGLVEEKTRKLQNAMRELEQTNKNLEQVNQELKKLEESKQQYLDFIGKEITGALTEVTSVFQVIKYKVDSKKVGQLIDRIDNSMEKVNSFITTALRITQLQSIGSTLNVERVDINKITGFSLLKLEDQIRRKQLKFDLKVPDYSVYVLGESNLLATCLLVVFEFFIQRNAINATIGIEIQDFKPGVKIIISDNGPVIDEKDLQSLFDVFSLQRQSLRFAKIITEAHYGKINIENKDPQGIILSIDIFTNENDES